MKLSWPGLAAACALAACGAHAEPTPRAITVEAKAVPLKPGDRSQVSLGALTYAGGLELSSRSEGFGGLSGLSLSADGSLMAVSDAGDLLRGTLRFDAAGRPTALDATSLTRLQDETGAPYASKMAADAEDLTLLDDGGLAVSFEQDHRIMVYAPGRKPRRLPRPPDAELGPNMGIEALTLWRDRSGAQRLVMGAEDGDAWSCDMAGRDCRQILESGRDNPGKAYRLTGLAAVPDGSLVALYRAATITGGLRAVIAQVRPGAARPVAELARLAGGVTVDNMEGIAVVQGTGGAVRLYVLSDDNFAGWQRTLLLAFDWKP